MLIQFKTGRRRNVPAIRGRALIRAGAAVEVPVEGSYQTRDMRATAPATPPQETSETEIQTLRADYQDIYGKKPYMGWDEATLRQKIDEGLNA